MTLVEYTYVLVLPASRGEHRGEVGGSSQAIPPGPKPSREMRRVRPFAKIAPSVATVKAANVKEKMDAAHSRVGRIRATLATAITMTTTIRPRIVTFGIAMDRPSARHCDSPRTIA